MSKTTLDAQALRRALRLDQYTQFYEHWYGRVRQYARRYFALDPDDFAQDFFLAAWAKHLLERYQPGRVPFEKFIQSCVKWHAKNCAKKVARREKYGERLARQSRSEVEAPEADHVGDEPGADDPGFSAVECQIMNEWLDRELQKLSPVKSKRARDLLQDLVRFEGNQTQIARQRGLTRQTVNAQVKKFRDLPALQDFKRDLLEPG